MLTCNLRPLTSCISSFSHLLCFLQEEPHASTCMISIDFCFRGQNTVSTCDCMALATTGQVLGLWDSEGKEGRDYTCRVCTNTKSPKKKGWNQALECIINFRKMQWIELDNELKLSLLPEEIKSIFIDQQYISRGFLSCCLYEFFLKTEATLEYIQVHATLTLLPPSLCMLWPTFIQLSSTIRVTKQEILHRVRFIFIIIPLALLAVSEKHSAIWTCLLFTAGRNHLELAASLTQFPRPAESLRPHTHSILSVQVCATQTLDLPAAQTCVCVCLS